MIVLEFFTACNFLVDMRKFVEKILLFECLIIQPISMLDNKEKKTFFFIENDDSFIPQQSTLELFVSAFDRFDSMNEVCYIDAFHVHVIVLIRPSIKKDKKFKKYFSFSLSIFQLTKKRKFNLEEIVMIIIIPAVHS